MSQLASLASRPDPAADTLAHYQALPVAHHQLEEATYESEALGVDFFLCADGKAQVLMAGCQNWKAESPGATVCWVCMRNRALCLATFGTASARGR